jgi:catechol 2,3-dioxygenase-like lactoylglutathione lyase family enzyme
MLDHVSLSVADDSRSKAFYAKALAPLGYSIIAEYEGGFGVGAESGSAVWVAKGQPQKPIAHLAFRAGDRKQVAAFHKAALAAGGRDNGAPGLRENYSPTYYAAFVIDPDGNNVEAVCHSHA